MIKNFKFKCSKKFFLVISKIIRSEYYISVRVSEYYIRVYFFSGLNFFSESVPEIMRIKIGITVNLYGSNKRHKRYGKTSFYLPKVFIIKFGYLRKRAKFKFKHTKKF